jgi:hypothetical protein
MPLRALPRFPGSLVNTFDAPVQLKYHGDAVRLLPRIPEFSKSAAKLVQQRELQMRVCFPDSVREWYSLEGAAQILAQYSNDDLAVDIEDLGETFDDWYGGGPRDFLADKLLLFMHENQGVSNWAIRLDGSEDPPVVVEVDTAPNAIWLTCADRFSTFVCCQIWDHLRLGMRVSAQEIELSERDLRFLESNFHRLHTTYGWPGRVNYRFESRNASILIWDGKDRGVDWFLSAPTASELEDLLGTVWRCGNLAESMYGDGVAEEVLRRMRSGAAEHRTTDS